MKKGIVIAVLAVLCSLSLVFGLAACAPGGSGTGDGTGGTSSDGGGDGTHAHFCGELVER